MSPGPPPIPVGCRRRWPVRGRASRLVSTQFVTVRRRKSPGLKDNRRDIGALAGLGVIAVEHFLQLFTHSRQLLGGEPHAITDAECRVLPFAGIAVRLVG